MLIVSMLINLLFNLKETTKKHHTANTSGGVLHPHCQIYIETEMPNLQQHSLQYMWASKLVFVVSLRQYTDLGNVVPWSWH